MPLLLVGNPMQPSVLASSAQWYLFCLSLLMGAVWGQGFHLFYTVTGHSLIVTLHFPYLPLDQGRPFMRAEWNWLVGSES